MTRQAAAGAAPAKEAEVANDDAPNSVKSKKYPIEKVKLTSIQTAFFVRKRLDEDRVIQLALLMENEADIPPIRITEDHILIDGRHRIEAARLAGWSTIDAQIEPSQDDKGVLIAEAFNANCGGSVPPTKADILFTIQQLLQQGWGEGKIIKFFPFPGAVTRRYVSDTRSKIRDARLNQAVMDVRDRGYTLVQAAENRGIEPEAIKAAMGKVAKKVAGKEEYKGNLTTRFRQLSRTNAQLLQKLFEAYENGEVGIDYVREIIDHTASLHAQALKTFDGWRERFAAILAQEKTVAK